MNQEQTAQPQNYNYPQYQYPGFQQQIQNASDAQQQQYVYPQMSYNPDIQNQINQQQSVNYQQLQQYPQFNDQMQNNQLPVGYSLGSQNEQQQVNMYNQYYNPQAGMYSSQFQAAQQPAIQTRDPIIVSCPFCGNIGQTEIQHQVGTSSYVIAGICLLVGCWPCCLFPFCIDSCKDAVHVCRQCRNVLQRRQLSEDICNTCE